MLNPFYTGYPHQQQLYPSVSQPPPSYPFGAQLQTNQQQYGQFEQEKSIDEIMQLYLSNDDQKSPPYPFNGSQQQQKQQQQQQLIFDQLDKYLNMQQQPQPKVQAKQCPVYPPPPIQQQSPMYQPPPIQQPPMYPPPNHPPFYNGLPMQQAKKSLK
uniref:Amelogenin n=1 Tax=Panagrolaimus sp. PS1159 TaxID=55785 RepID=A0AC35FS89_9BILA